MRREIINRVAYKLQLIEQKQQVDACFIVFPELSQKYEENICKKIVLNRCIEIVTPIELFKRLGLEYTNEELEKLAKNRFATDYDVYKTYIEDNEFKNLNRKLDEAAGILEKNVSEVNAKVLFPKDLYDRHFSSNTIARLNKNDSIDKNDLLHIGTSYESIIILESDIVNFSTMVTAYGEKTIAAIMKDYYKSVKNLCNSYDAFLDKFVGDAVLVAFNYPFNEPDKIDYLKILEFSFELIEIGKDKFGHLNRENDRQTETGTRVGIAMGTVQVIESRPFEITFIGNTVNLAARLEHNCEINKICVSNVIYNKFLESVYALEYKAKFVETEHLFSEVDVKGQLLPVKAFIISKINNSSINSITTVDGAENSTLMPTPPQARESENL